MIFYLRMLDGLLPSGKLSRYFYKWSNPSIDRNWCYIYLFLNLFSKYFILYILPIAGFLFLLANISALLVSSIIYIICSTSFSTTSYNNPSFLFPFFTINILPSSPIYFFFFILCSLISTSLSTSNNKSSKF